MDAVWGVAADLNVDVSDGGLDAGGTRLLVLGLRLDGRVTAPELFESLIGPHWIGQRVRVLSEGTAETRVLGGILPVLHNTFGEFTKCGYRGQSVGLRDPCRWTFCELKRLTSIFCAPPRT